MSRDRSSHTLLNMNGQDWPVVGIPEKGEYEGIIVHCYTKMTILLEGVYEMGHKRPQDKSINSALALAITAHFSDELFSRGSAKE